MDYEKKYKEALEKARQLCAYPTTKPFISDLQDLFPELKESEDKQIRKELIDYLKERKSGESYGQYVLRYDRWINWLEKQDESDETKIQNHDDKVEPKFKEGQWIIFNGLTLYIKEVVQGYYRTISKGGTINSYDWGIDNAARLWTIQDAKDGDVLAVNSEVFIYAHRKQMYPIVVAHCFVDSAGGFRLDGEFGFLERGNSISPATKEQRDLLFSKMKEEGYEWSAWAGKIYE